MTIKPMFWNLFNQKTYQKPQKAPVVFEPIWHGHEWNEAYETYLTQQIKELEAQVIIKPQVEKLLQISYYLEKALTKPHAKN